ncbi:MAG: helix-turn-helix domain-containing protein [Phycisphaerae bacterium]|nr:helix-turn-helix domain containing protein [Candidatus Saccharibacteria bacterium]NIP49246.1 helix-turn-helix domain containing protein [Gammaproteobacteria bacterium]NIR49731.1 helix-turn-helix domain containing protein [candidate division KSB1 bacterium]NIV01148.1 helix-turn-helix domain-containing protein [Phycisphaerae bacterium]NIS25171.1 helix-turn-helix domain containing protein [candidate division KSB1 bacterium]
MKKEHVKLSEADRTYLEKLIKKGSLPAKTYKRALALLELDRGRTFTEVAEIVGVVIQTASSWAKKYKEAGLEFLTDKPRSGRPTVFDGLDRANITALACSDPPEGYERWSLRMLADKAVELELVESISYGEVRLILKKTNSSPT